MKRQTIYLRAAAVLAAVFVSGVGGARAGDVSVEYGMVTDAKPIEMAGSDKDRKTAGTAAGGLLGGVAGYAVGKGSSKGKKIRGILIGTAGGAVAGNQVAKAAGKSHQYSVKLTGGDSVTITTEQGRIDTGDCVAIERGDMANIRKVSQVHCQAGDKKASAEHITEAKECEAAKAAIDKADTDEAMAAAVKRARLKCEE